MIIDETDNFRTWIGEVFDRLIIDDWDCKLGLTEESLKIHHWNQLREIYKEYEANTSLGGKEGNENEDASFDSAIEVILDAHGKTRGDLEEESQMAHYMNSRSYD